MDRVTSVRKGASLTTTRTYRPEDGVLTAINTPSVQAMNFGFDGVGNLTSRSDTGVSESYGYDNLNRLKTRNGSDIAVYQPNGNITSKTEVGGTPVTINAYDPARPHAVSSYTFNGQTIGITYDLNGNLLTRSGGGATWTMNWAGFDKPRWMAKTTGTTTVGSEFHYNAARSRVMQREFNAIDGSGPTQYNRKRVYALGSTLELNYTTAAPALNPTWDLMNIRIYIPGPDGIVGAREFSRPTSATSTFTEKALVYHYDHHGSITATTLHTTGALANDNDTSNPKPAKYSEDAWGQRRNPFTWSGAPLTTDPNKSDDGSFDSATPRGYTGHEMLDDLGLVHMNGRIYDPLLGRFLSADILVQAPGTLQSYNRYSYVANNPLSLTDPSGFEIAEISVEKTLDKMFREKQKQAFQKNAERSVNGTSAQDRITGQESSETVIDAADSSQVAKTTTPERVDRQKTDSNAAGGTGAGTGKVDSDFSIADEGGFTGKGGESIYQEGGKTIRIGKEQLAITPADEHPESYENIVIGAKITGELVQALVDLVRDFYMPEAKLLPKTGFEGEKTVGGNVLEKVLKKGGVSGLGDGMRDGVKGFYGLRAMMVGVSIYSKLNYQVQKSFLGIKYWSAPIPMYQVVKNPTDFPSSETWYYPTKSAALQHVSQWHSDYNKALQRNFQSILEKEFP